MSEKFISYDNLKQYDEFLDKELQDIKQHVDEGFTFNVKYAESDEIGGAAIKAVNDETGENIAEHFKTIENDVAINKTTVGYQIKNLIKHITTTSRTVNGVAFKVNSDNSITLNGTATSSTDFYIYGSWGNTTPVLSEPQIYTISMGSEFANSGMKGFVITNGTWTVKEFAVASTNWTVTDDVASTHITCLMIRVPEGTTVNNITLYPMIRYSFITDDTYEPYVDNVDTRITENKSDIVINKTTLGYTRKNLFPVNSKSMSANGWVMGGGTDIYKLYIPKGEYIFSFKQTGTGQSEINFYDSTNTQITRILPYVSTANILMTYKITLSSDCYGVKFYNSSGENTYSEIMMRSADITDDTYEPYVESVDERLQNFVKSGSGAKSGLVPAPPTTAGTTKYLREDGTWQVPPYLPVRSGYGLSQGLYSATTGTIGYVLLCTIKITGTYQNTPTTIVYTQRGDSEAVYLSVSFASTNNTDPALNKFTYFGPSYVRAYIVKSTTSTWQIYIQKTESYDSISLLYYAKPYHSDQTTITWNNTQVTTLPTGYVKATRGGNVAYADKATYDKNGKDISTTYLPLAGGTMNGDATITIPSGSSTRATTMYEGGLKISLPDNSASATGVQYFNSSGTSMGTVGGFFDENQALKYFYMGPYNSPYLKVDGSGNGTFKGSCTATSFSGNATSATKLATARTIDGVSFNGTAAITHLGTCSTAAGTKAKDVALSGFSLVTGARISVRFTNTNTTDEITLNVNSTGAKPVCYVGSKMTARTLKLQANNIYGFVYDGANWIYEGDSSYSSQNNTTTDADYRILFSHTADDVTERGVSRKSSKFTANPSTGVLTATTFSGNATSATRLTNTTVIGGTTKPVFFNASGQPQACSYSLGKSVPSNAVFTDTNTYMTQSNTTANNTYPLLLRSTAGTTTTSSSATTGYYSNNFYVNPSTGVLSAKSFKSIDSNLIASGSVTIPAAKYGSPQSVTVTPENFNGSYYSSLVLNIYNAYGGIASTVIPMNYLLAATNNYIYIPVHFYSNNDEMGMFRPMHMHVKATSTSITLETPYEGGYWTENHNNFTYKLYKI